eukprot:CAMPEP_0116085196 /NCGR_PEP_ID=MMETSP0327-20121206/4196_1 /TAXON_ID=44447 /ORGANISM="Pseudo-nitzschia delicatissima, Strain B596" /LENGTH=784 /DNA_ID=CAMNT_0003576171 /DNA_START=301 /DNA_END=2655 /DNA_ORIENTATION=-
MTDAGTSAAPAASTSRFTEAIPLSLSSMAHTALPLEDGVLDGLKNTIQHTLWSSLSYARKAFGLNFSPVDLCTSPQAWTPTKLTSLPLEDAIPSSLKKKHGFNHSYQRTALVYLRPAMNSNSSSDDAHKWTDDPAALARINFLYAATDEMTPEELDVVNYEEEDALLAKKQKAKKKKSKKRSADEISNENSDDEDAAPPPPKHIILYKATVEYRSLPATGNQSAVRAEELSMLSFGGSLVDDDVKYGALASLYDDNAKYVLEILGVRGKKYRLDLMDATLSDGTVPTLPSRNTMSAVGREVGRRGRGPGAVIPTDPFVKRLCVAVTDHEPSTKGHSIASAKPTGTEGDISEEEKKSSAASANHKNPPYSLTTMRLSLEGGLRVPHLLNQTDLPAPNYYPSQIQKAFLSLRSTKPAENGKKKSASTAPDIVSSMPSGYRLLLDPAEAGKIYIHGRYVTTWGTDPRIGGAMNCTALFGMDLHSVPYWHGRIVDYDKLMLVYATLWTEILTDAKLISKNIGGRLLSRLITGHDPIDEEEDTDDDSDESDDDSDSDDESEDEPATMRLNTDMNCLESQVMASSQCDPVGISAKALATKFQNEYGMEGYPCLTHEMDWVKDRLPGRVPVVVPQRLIAVLRRGGFFDIKRTSEEVWFAESRPATEGTDEEAIVKRTCELLVEAKCNDVLPSSIVFGGNTDLVDPVQKKGLIRINRLLRQYHVNESFLTTDLQHFTAGDDDMEEDAAKDESEEAKKRRIEALAMILGMHIAREHPDGNVLMRYMLQHMVEN